MDNATAMDDNVVNMDDPLWIMSLLQHKKKARRTGGCTIKEDKCLCEAWMTLSEDPICDAKKEKRHVNGRLPSSFMSVRISLPALFIVIEAKSQF
jgi:hypothetical protein